MALVGVMVKNELPELSFLVRPTSENSWSDLLATLIATDPGPAVDLLGLSVSAQELSVEREVVGKRGVRYDLLLTAGGEVLAVIEVKVLSGLGPEQLSRYEEERPEVQHRFVVYPESLIVDVAATPRWKGLTWEALLGAYLSSPNSWCRSTAAAWRGYLSEFFPEVDGATRWNDLREGENFPIAMRARLSWVFSRLQPPAPIQHDLVSSAAGDSAVVRLYRPAAVEGYKVVAEVEERLGVRSIPKFASSQRAPLGPSIRVALMQENIRTSANFDWGYLQAMWPVMEDSGLDWVRHRARPRNQHDRDNYLAMVARGGPKHLGVGLGEAQARINGACMFGARIQLRPEIRLDELVDELHAIANLLDLMAEVQPR